MSDPTTATLVAPFRESWAFTRALTRSFIEATPDEAWTFTPHERYGSIGRQFRHVVQVTDLYADLLQGGSLRMAAKFARHDGGLERDALLSALTRADAELDDALSSPELGTHDTFDFGGEPMSLGVVLGVLLEHEANHHGLWSAYAALGGWASPPSWRQTWDL